MQAVRISYLGWGLLMGSGTLSIQAQDWCNDILLGGIYNSYQRQSTRLLSEVLADHLCHSQKKRNVQDRQTGGRFSLNFGDLDLGLGGNGSRITRGSFTQEYCRDRSYGAQFYSRDQILASVASDEIMEQWQSCMNLRYGANQPLLCYLQKDDRLSPHISVTLKYGHYVGELQSSNFQYQNLRFKSGVANTLLKFGEHRLLVEMLDPEQSGKLVINANTETHNYSCELIIPKRISPSVAIAKSDALERCKEKWKKELKRIRVNEYDYQAMGKLDYYPVFDHEGEFHGYESCKFIN